LHAGRDCIPRLSHKSFMPPMARSHVVIRVPRCRHSVNAAIYAKSASADISPGSVFEANQFKVFTAQSLKGYIVDSFAELLG
jgi:hypothetical protein